MSVNLLSEVENSLLNKTFGKGLISYTQLNCQVTLTNDGYRIYRPPNLTVANNGNTMWGGLRIQPYGQNNSDVLFKGHTYVVKFHVKGKSSNAVSSLGWTNSMGWSGGGLFPSPSNVEHNPFGANFQGELDYYYKFTINDDVYKICTKSYSSYIEGETYLSYRDFQFGFGYTSTGTMGTDIYLTNIRMYDITDDILPIKLSVNGNAKFGDIFETDNSTVSLQKYGSLFCDNIIEY